MPQQPTAAAPKPPRRTGTTVLDNVLDNMRTVDAATPAKPESSSAARSPSDAQKRFAPDLTIDGATLGPQHGAPRIPARTRFEPARSTPPGPAATAEARQHTKHLPAPEAPKTPSAPLSRAFGASAASDPQIRRSTSDAAIATAAANERFPGAKDDAAGAEHEPRRSTSGNATLFATYRAEDVPTPNSILDHAAEIPPLAWVGGIALISIIVWLFSL